MNNYSLFDICKNEWYPLITEYEESNGLFGTYSEINSLRNTYNTFKYILIVKI